jgi:tRNA G10  N-methylase Trm11
MDYLFVLGKAGPICQAELESVLRKEQVGFKKIFSDKEIYHLTVNSFFDANYLISLLGGTVKISQVVDQTEAAEKLPDILFRLVSENEKQSHGKLTFGLSVLGNFSFLDLKVLSGQIKQRLQERGIKARFVLPTEDRILSSVVVQKQKVLEFIIAFEKNQLVLARTLTVQNFQEWARQDFGRPAFDPKSGMLAPKVARMMVNLLSQKEGTILDPFCGSGTILMEALLVSYPVLGSDQSQEAIFNTEKNLNWLSAAYPERHFSFKLIKSEATSLSQKLKHASIGAIVTEPYLGPAIRKENINKIRQNLDNIVLGLEKLYRGCLRDWLAILKPGAEVILALPSFKFTPKEIFVKKTIDTCENLGYTLLAGPYQYSRPQAVVVRNIFKLVKK